MKYVLLLAVLAAIIYGIYLLKNFAASRRERRLRSRLDAALEGVRETAWQYRDIAPELSAVIIDEVNKQKKKEQA